MKKAIFNLLFLLASCQLTHLRINNEGDLKEAEKVVSDFYQNIALQRFNEAYKLMYSSNDSIRVMELFTRISQELPSLKQRKLDHWQTIVKTGLEESGFYYLFYINEYDKFELKFLITLQKDDDNKIKINGIAADRDKFPAPQPH
jgi:hypothetical protein